VEKSTPKNHRTIKKDDHRIKLPEDHITFPIREIIEEFINDRKAKGLSIGTLQFYHHRLKLPANYCDEVNIISIEGLTSDREFCQLLRVNASVS
jgi:hypothetical protein